MTTTPDARRVRALRGAAIAIAFVGVVVVVFRPSDSLLAFGVVNGALYGLAAAGVVLVHRTHRIVNFAAVALGALPAVTMTLLQTVHGLGYWPALAMTLAGGAVLGGLVETIVVRRFARAPRLMLTIATIAVVQVIALGGEHLAARILRDRSVPSRVPTPWDDITWVDHRGAPIFTGDHLAALVAIVVVGAGLACILRFTRAGLAVRGAAENLDRAHLLGVPVARLHTATWMAAGLIGAVVVFFRIPLVGVPVDPTLGPTVTLFVVAAAVVARLDSIPVALAAGVAMGLLEQASVAQIGSGDLTSVLVLVVVVAALLVAPWRPSGRDDTEEDSWSAAAEPRPVPRRLRRLPEVRAAGAVVGLVVAAAALAAPWIVSAGQLGKLTLIPITAIVGVSLVVLTGWAGQVSLGQFAFAGAGAGIAGGLAANHTADFFVALGAGVASGAIVAVVVGLPAARVRGVYLAVTTLALAGAMESYVLKRGHPVHDLVLPHGEAPRVERPVLYRAVDLADDRAFYFVALAFLVLTVVVARAFRHSRSGRVVVAARDDPQAAAAYGVNVVAARLAAFALAGALAATGGVLLAYQQGSVDAGTYGVVPSVEVFLATVLGGIASPMGAVLGATALQSVRYFVEPHLRDASLLFEGPLLLLVLVANPGGITAGLHRVRERLLDRIVTRRRLDEIAVVEVGTVA